MKSNEFFFATSEDISKTLGKRAQYLRVNVIKKSQADFAEKIGINVRKYQRFEQGGDIKLDDFITIVRHLNRLEEIENLLEAPDVKELGIKKLRNKEPDKKRVFKK